ncbi:hypothetical protein [uncultured Acetobacteroides sp.]|uniref:hypothetical protein n=1 Tax=uncultured Acetobacteroides sp. TaxID=1760811 RepID=UPI0029F466FF|nr:hypothetical protein [uncultured Acetobacteroides sp.]
MTAKVLALLLVLATLLSCSSKNSNQAAGKPAQPQKITASTTPSCCYIVGNDSVAIRPFEITVSLSPKARAKIVGNKETIFVDVSITGEHKPTTPAKLIAEDGQFYVASVRKEIRYGQVARFDSIKMSRYIYNELLNKDADVTVNVYSGRKSSEDNLLNSELLSEKISKVVNRKSTIKSKLIYGDD